MFTLSYNSTRVYIPAKSSKTSPSFNEKQPSVKLLSKILSLVPNNQTSPSLDDQIDHPHSTGIISGESKLQENNVNQNCDDRATTTNDNIELSNFTTNLNLDSYAIEAVETERKGGEYKDEINDDLGVSKELQSDDENESENESMSDSSGYISTN